MHRDLKDILNADEDIGYKKLISNGTLNGGMPNMKVNEST